MSPEATHRKRERGRAWYHANRERVRAYRAANRPRINAARRKLYANTPGPKAKQREVRYGLSIGEFDKLLAAQSGLCAICKTPMKCPQVDHDHTHARARALLCKQCNVGLGMFKESMNLLFAASEYLRYWKIKYEN